MKAKHGLIISLAAFLTTAVLRVLQYIFIIDNSGLFSINSVFDKVLSVSLYGMIGVLALIAVLWLFIGDKTESYANGLLNNSGAGCVSITAAAVLLFDSGVRLGQMMANKTLDWVAILSLASALYFALLAFDAFAKRTSRVTAVLGFFPPIYICVYGVKAFFDSFEKVHVSESKLEILTICALAMMLISFSCSKAGVNISKKRLGAFTMLYISICAPTSLAKLIAFAFGKVTQLYITEFVFALFEIAVAVLGVIILAKLDSAQAPVVKNEEVVTDMSDLDLYIDQIPEEKEEISE